MAGLTMSGKPRRGWSLALSSGTFTRSSRGWYLTGTPGDGSSAFMAAVNTDVLRTENRGDGAGALTLLEGARTNAFKRSRDVGHGDWLTNFTTKTSNYGNGTDATGVAGRIEIATDGNLYQVTGAGPSSGVMSSWVRARTGSGQSVGLSLDPSPAAAIFSSIDTTYRQVSLFKNGSYTTPCAIDAYDRTANGGGNPSGVDVLVDHVQVEADVRFPSSPIETAGTSATRAADTLTWTSGQVPAALFSGRGEFSAFSPYYAISDIGSGDVFWLLSIAGSSDGIRIEHTGGIRELQAWQGGAKKASLDISSVWSSRHALVGAISWDPAAGKVYCNGTPGAAGTAWTWSSGAVRVGGIHGGSGNEAFARFGDLRSW